MKNPSKIMFLGDTHANTNWLVAMIERARLNDCDTIVQLGDFGYRFDSNFMKRVRYALGANDVDLYFVDGNHDEHSTPWAWPFDADGFQIPAVGTHRERLHYIPRGHRWEWWGLKFLGLGGAASVDRQWRTEYTSWWSTEYIREKDINKAVDGGTVDVMVTHDHPVNVPIPSESHRHETNGFGWPEFDLKMSRDNRQALQAVVDEVKPKLYLHGHYHSRRDIVVDGMRVIGLDMDGTTFERAALIVTEDELKGMVNDKPVEPILP